MFPKTAEVKLLKGYPPNHTLQTYIFENYTVANELKIIQELKLEIPADGEHDEYREWLYEQYGFWQYEGVQAASTLDTAERERYSYLRRIDIPDFVLAEIDYVNLARLTYRPTENFDTPWSSLGNIATFQWREFLNRVLGKKKVHLDVPIKDLTKEELRQAIENNPSYWFLENGWCPSQCSLLLESTFYPCFLATDHGDEDEDLRFGSMQEFEKLEGPFAVLQKIEELIKNRQWDSIRSYLAIDKSLDKRWKSLQPLRDILEANMVNIIAFAEMNEETKLNLYMVLQKIYSFVVYQSTTDIVSTETYNLLISMYESLQNLKQQSLKLWINTMIFDGTTTFESATADVLKGEACLRGYAKQLKSHVLIYLAILFGDYRIMSCLTKSKKKRQEEDEEEDEE